MGQLTEKGYSIFLKDRLLHLKDKQEHLVARVEIGRNRMYKLNLRSIWEKCLWVDVEDKASLWHLYFGHLHHGGLKELVKKNMAHGLPNMDFEGKFCEECVLSKHARTSIQKNAKFWTKLLDKTWVFPYLDSHDYINSQFDHLTNTSNELTNF